MLETMIILKRNLIDKYIVILLGVLLLGASCFSCSQKDFKASERKQSFDYDWKFFLGDTIGAGQMILMMKIGVNSTYLTIGALKEK